MGFLADTDAMLATALTPAPDTRGCILRIQALTGIWMSVEAAVSLAAAWRAHSPALLAFGGDSAIELLSALVVFWRFRTKRVGEGAERLAARVAGGLLLALAVYVVAASALVLLRHREAEPSPLGIAVLLAAAVIMPSLAKQKRQLSAITASAALKADAAQSALCAYMSWIALVGLVANGLWRVGWADPIAALCLVPLILREGWQALKGRPCECC